MSGIWSGTLAHATTDFHEYAPCRFAMSAAICMFAGRMAARRTTLAAAAHRFRAKSPAAHMISAAPLAYTRNVGAGRERGTIPANVPGRTKWRMPLAVKRTTSAVGAYFRISSVFLGT
jgi:hypothetical protein